MKIEARIKRLQIDINNLYEKLKKITTPKRAENIQARILYFYEELYKLEVQLKNRTKVCPICNKEFIPKQDNSICCSIKCYQRYYYFKKTKLKRAEIREAKPLKACICQVCGKTFYIKASTKPQRKYCSEECREIGKQRNKENLKKYQKTETYKEKQRQYRKSEKYQTWYKEYQQSEKYKERIREYHKTENFKEKQKLYRQTEKYREYQREYQRKHRKK